MIIEVTHEGGGIFKVWPEPNGMDVEKLRDHILAFDPSNKEAREKVGLFDGGDFEEATEAANNAEATAKQHEEALEEIQTITENADEKGAEETQMAIGKIIKRASDALY
jgi:ferric-dicitrate binding protein FerR (iron transport regulator)